MVHHAAAQHERPRPTAAPGGGDQSCDVVLGPGDDGRRDRVVRRAERQRGVPGQRDRAPGVEDVHQPGQGHDAPADRPVVTPDAELPQQQVGQRGRRADAVEVGDHRPRDPVADVEAGAGVTEQPARPAEHPDELAVDHAGGHRPGPGGHDAAGRLGGTGVVHREDVGDGAQPGRPAGDADRPGKLVRRQEVPRARQGDEHVTELGRRPVGLAQRRPGGPGDGAEGVLRPGRGRVPGGSEAVAQARAVALHDHRPGARSAGVHSQQQTRPVAHGTNSPQWWTETTSSASSSSTRSAT